MYECCVYLRSTNQGEYKLVSSGRGLMRAGLNSVISSEERMLNENNKGSLIVTALVFRYSEAKISFTIILTQAFVRLHVLPVPPS